MNLPMSSPFTVSGMKARAPMPSCFTVALRVASSSAASTLEMETGCGSFVSRVQGEWPFDSYAVAVGKTAPGDEFHDAGIVKQEDGSAITPEGAHDGIEPSFMNVFDRRSTK